MLGLDKNEKNTCTKSKFEFGKSFGFVFHAIEDGVKKKLLLLFSTPEQGEKNGARRS